MSETDDTATKANQILSTFRVSDGLYLLGSLERGVTVYKQQLRAHNLAWAIWELEKEGKFGPLDRIAVVGGGIAGMTTAACIISLMPNSQVSIFEQLWDLCPLQQGADTRWLHPRIYDWPQPGSRAPTASLPILNWTEGRASDVARSVLTQFGRIGDRFDPEGIRAKVRLGLGHLRIMASEKQIDWTGHETIRESGFFRVGAPVGHSEQFDQIILASGFGLETVDKYPTIPYWRNDQIGQPNLDGTRRNFLVSGYGDGALTDLFRLTIERFRQDTVLYEIFGDRLEEVEQHFAGIWKPEMFAANIFTMLHDSEEHWLKEGIAALSGRVRKDSRVVLNIRGKNGDNTTFQDVFGPNSSFLNRLLLYLLYRCGAFAISFATLDESAGRFGVENKNVLCRHGADTLAHLSGLFSDFDTIKPRLLELKEEQSQSTKLSWTPGTFPHIS